MHALERTVLVRISNTIISVDDCHPSHCILLLVIAKLKTEFKHFFVKDSMLQNSLSAKWSPGTGINTVVLSRLHIMASYLR